MYYNECIMIIIELIYLYFVCAGEMVWHPAVKIGFQVQHKYHRYS